MKELNDAEFRLMAELYFEYARDGDLEYSLSDLAELLGKSKGTVSKLIGSLREKHYIATKNTGRYLIFTILKKNSYLKLLWRKELKKFRVWNGK